MLLRIRRIEFTTREGVFWIDPGSYFGLTLLERDVYEPEMVAVVKQFVPTGGTFVDVGANEGYFAVIGAGQAGAA